MSHNVYLKNGTNYLCQCKTRTTDHAWRSDTMQPRNKRHPTNEAGELREQLAKWVPVETSTGQHPFDAILALHQADKEKAIQAELENLTDEQEDIQDWQRANPGYTADMILASKVHKRITALKKGTES